MAVYGLCAFLRPGPAEKGIHLPYEFEETAVRFTILPPYSPARGSTCHPLVQIRQREDQDPQGIIRRAPPTALEPHCEGCGFFSKSEQLRNEKLCGTPICRKAPVGIVGQRSSEEALDDRNLPTDETGRIAQ